MDDMDIGVVSMKSKFTVNKKGKKVMFSKGNLWYNTSEDQFHFEDNQYDFQTRWNKNHVDKFYWSSKKSVAVAKDYSDPNRTTEDGFFAASNFTVEGYDKWSTLTYDEWNYLLFDRKTKITGVGNSNASFAKVKVNGVKGLILFPDTFTWTSEMGNKPSYINDVETYFLWSHVTSYTNTQFKAQESAGMVFLPTCGYRHGSSCCNYEFGGNYWSSTLDCDYAVPCCLFFSYGDEVGFMTIDDGDDASSVRLVMSEN